MSVGQGSIGSTNVYPTSALFTSSIPLGNPRLYQACKYLCGVRKIVEIGVLTVSILILAIVESRLVTFVSIVVKEVSNTIVVESTI